MYAIAWMEQQVKGEFAAGIVADEVGLGKVLFRCCTLTNGLRLRKH